MHERRVVITGMGVISPLGHTVEEFWQNLLAGKSGVGAITRFDAVQFDTKIAAEVKNFNAEDYIDKKEARRMDLFTHFALAAAKLALEDSGLLAAPIDKDSVGVIVSSGIGGMDTFEREGRKLFEKGPGRISPFFIPMMIADIAPGHISMQYGFKGPNYSIISACASSSHAIGESFRYVQRGEADAMICGGSEATITPMGVGGFNAMKALSTRNDDPQRASRPFDLERDGFVMGEGGGILVLESLESASRRNAKIYAEVVGAGYSADAYHITQPAPGGEGAVRAMRIALKNAGVAPEDVQYINAHGTSTPANDKNETQAIATVFGDHAAKLNISSTKSMIGHLLGASGAVELIATALTCRDDMIHPTINQITADPECFLNYTPNAAVRREVNVAISNSFGFGGHNVCLVVKKFIL
ncbi:MAG: beta-ketoacyl-ACP synthase II [candidate division KSB1 bacterium]|nr:beta-ketoacyl-ACP synthase II [candidate division KSB1 bacterium]MDZ7364667.1 beta-ketoacyl-ACP synthase II [candidate division KSB1 bacterium]MDZ7402585.1 beta-ketoacyl-ACP synthase II [candidate division KSB1 bacterium]